MIDWTKPVCTKHETPLIGEIKPDETPGIKRVALASLSCQTGPSTTYRYDENGSARQGAGESPYDLVNFDPEDGVVRMAADHRKVVAERKAA